MRIRPRSLFMVFLFSVHSLCAQQLEYSILTIPEELTANANLIVREEQIDIEIKSASSVVVKTNRVMTLLNENASKYGTIYEYYDKTRRIRGQQLLVYDKLGNQIAKFRGGDFQDFSAKSSADQYTDNRIKYIEYKPSQYPVTLVYESEVSTSETAFIEPYTPLPVPYLSVQKSRYRLLNPAKLALRYKESNLEGYDITNNNTEFELDYSLSMAPAQVREPLMPSIREMMPEVKVALSDFSLVNVKGKATNWEEFGAWQYQNLIQGLDDLPQETVLAVKKLVGDQTDKKEIARIVYEYVQNNTRYISIQLGIGGWKPYPAEEVDALGYGDCKGLTNYTKALLKSQGVESNYTVVYAGSEKKNIDSEFASMQGNHVILQVPLEEEEIWLECTSQTLPFNYLGVFTDDRDVLLITPEGGKITRTPSYLNEQNLHNAKGTFAISSEGGVSGQVEMTSEGATYYQKYELQTKSAKELRDHYGDLWDELKDLGVYAVNFNDDKDAVAFTEQVEIEATRYASFINEKLVFKPNLFNINNYVPRRDKNRMHDFQIQRGYKESDTYTFSVPEGMEVDFLPDPIDKTSPFGSYSLSVEANEDGTFTYSRTLLIKAGRYPAGQYNDYRNFRRTVKKHDNTKVIFK